MKVAKHVEQLRDIIKFWKRQGLKIGFVPTMGYLHEGHQSLIQRAAKENDKVVVSVFVNKMQFGPNEDFDAYPRDFERDCKKCEEAGADLVFHPENEEMYHEDFTAYVDMTGLTEGLCGKTRPIHFRGVCTIVTKLFNLVTPNRAYFGQKDAQQLAVITRMARDLNMNIEIIGCPIVREADGLAKSSRNTYLSEEERKAALVLSKSLKAAEEKIMAGEKSVEVIQNFLKESIEAEPLAKVDYASVVTWPALEEKERMEGDMLVAVAVYIGKTRLIDNVIVSVTCSYSEE